MTLRDLLGDGPDVDVAALAFDNRAVQPGTLFFCVPGFTRDGHDFAADAVERGAAALVVNRPLGLGVPEVLVDDVGNVATSFPGFDALARSIGMSLEPCPMLLPQGAAHAAVAPAHR